MAALNALFLGAPGVVSAGVARGWQMAGHRIAAFWYPQRMQGTRDFENDRALAQQAPGVSMHRSGRTSRRAVTRCEVASVISTPIVFANGLMSAERAVTEQPPSA